MLIAIGLIIGQNQGHVIAIGLIIRQKQGHVDSNRSNHQTESKSC